MYTLLLIVQVALAIGLIGLILIQHGKGADAGAAFGSGASSTVFGARGAGSFLTRTTAILATLFIANSLLLSTPLILGDRSAPASVTERFNEPAGERAPAPSDLPDAPTAPAGDMPDAPTAPGDDLPAAPPADSAPASDADETPGDSPVPTQEQTPEPAQP